MKPWFLMGILRDTMREGGDGGGGFGADVMEHTDEAATTEEAPAAKAVDPEIAALRAQVDSLSTRVRTAEEDAQFWAARGRGTQQVAAPIAEDELYQGDEDEEEVVDDNPETVLDDMTKKGVKALSERGFVTKKDLKEAVAGAVKETRAEIQETRADAEFGVQLQDEFPTIAAESTKISEAKERGQRYVSTDPLMVRTQEIYQRSVRMDPKLHGSKSMILVSARQAAAELAAEGGGGRPRKGAPVVETDDRRSRIARLNRTRTPDRDAEGDQGDELTSDQNQVIHHLKLKPEVYKSNQADIKAGRNHQGGRR